MTRLEGRLLKETSEMKEDVKKNLGALDSYVKKELEALSNRHKIEQEERKAGIKSLAQDLKDLNQTLQQKSSQLSDQLSTSERELRQQMLDQYRKLNDEIRAKSEAAAAALKREADELRLDKTDRSLLAGLFTEVGLRLRDELKIPGAEQLKKTKND